MENVTLTTHVNGLNNNLCTAMESLTKALADLKSIASAVGKLGEISALLGSVGAVGNIEAPKRKRRSRAEIEAEKAVAASK